MFGSKALFLSTVLTSMSLVACGGGDANGGSTPSGEIGGDGNGASGGGGNDAAAPGFDAGTLSHEAGGGGGGGGNDAGGGSIDSGGGGGSDSGGGVVDAGPFVPAAHPPFPQLVSNGGKVLSTPKVVGVFFSNFDHTTEVSAMLAGLPSVQAANGQPFWSASVGEYGVGALTVLPPIKLTEAAPTTGNVNVGSWLAGKIQSDSNFANVDTSTIVAIFYPSTTPLSGSCAAGGIGYGGYHQAVNTTKGMVPYAVMAECSNFGPITNSLDMVTVAGSHEIIEAVTDPFPNTSAAYASLDQNGWAMDILLQGNEENGDMCTINNGFLRPGGSYPYLLQRGWSNKAAAAGNVDPCAPDDRPGQPFVGAFPVMPDTVNAEGSNGPGVKIAVGASRTIEVDCFSFAPTPAFTVAARQSRSINPPELAFSWDKTTCVNGDKLHLTITVNSAGQNGYEAFLINAQIPNVPDAQAPAWAGIVTQK